MRIHRLLKKGRKEKGLTLIELQEITGISNALLSMMETGVVKEPSFKKVVQVSTALEIPLSRLAAAVSERWKAHQGDSITVQARSERREG